MTCTQISVLFMISNIIHSYIRQNHLLFLSWLAVYTTSIIYHYTKFNYPPPHRFRTLQYYSDISMVYIAYVIVFYELYVNSFYVLTLFHLSIPFVFFGSFYKQMLMWSQNEIISELWHSILHYFVIINSHIYLAN